MSSIFEEIFIIAKTYPTRSKKYKELVCTAGINRNGEWVRIYPIPFRSLEDYKQFKRYTWIKAEIVPDSSDPRIESHKINATSIKILESVPTDKEWGRRRQLILENTKIYKNLQTIIDGATKTNTLSLCTFKPTKFLDIEVDKNPNEELTEKEKKEYINANRTLFGTESCELEFTGMPHIPYKFKIKLEDDVGKISSMSVIDWEIQQLYLNCKHEGDDIAVQKVKDKLLWMMNDRDLYLFLGTMKQMHIRKSKNPYTIIGLFYPPRTTRYQGTLF